MVNTFPYLDCRTLHLTDYERTGPIVGFSYTDVCSHLWTDVESILNTQREECNLHAHMMSEFFSATAWSFVQKIAAESSARYLLLVKCTYHLQGKLLPSSKTSWHQIIYVTMTTIQHHDDINNVR